MNDASDILVIHVSEDLRADNALRARIEWANELLNEVARASYLVQELRSAGIAIRGDWRPVQASAGRKALEFTLATDDAAVSTQFGPGDLDDDNRTGYKLHRLWGDLLAIYSRRGLQKLLESSGRQESC